MTLFLSQVMNGIGQGVVYASLALALVLIYRTTGILNFAQGEMALFSTYVMFWFTERGLPVWLAILVTVVLSFVGGAADRALRDAAGRALVAARDRHRHDRAVPHVQLAVAGDLRRRRRDRAARVPQPQLAPRWRHRPRRHARAHRGPRGRVPAAVPALAEDEGRARVARGRVEPGVEPARRCVGRARC